MPPHKRSRIWSARKDDQVGTLGRSEPQDIVAAAGLIRRGAVLALGIPLDQKGPQNGLFGGRWDPIHTMLATGAMLWRNVSTRRQTICDILMTR
jgi:hypothetical protein